MAATLNYEIKKYWKMFRLDDDPGEDENRGKYARSDVLIYLLLCTNGRLRCWPSMAQIADDLGINKEKACCAISWLVSRKAVSVVPYDKRIGSEKKLHNRQNVYQLTGIIQFTGAEPIQYLYMRPGEMKEVIEELNAMDEGATAAILTEFCPEPEKKKTSDDSEVQSPGTGLSQSPGTEFQSPGTGLSQSPGTGSLHYIELESLTEIHPSSSSSSKELTRAGGEVIDETPKKDDEDEDQESDPEIAEIFVMYEQNMPGTLTPIVADQIKDAIAEFTPAWVKDAIREAVLRNARNWVYIDKILQSWKLEGRDKQLKRKPFPSPSSGPPPPQQWFDEEGKPDPEGIYTERGAIGRAPKEYRGKMSLSKALNG